MYRFNNHKVFLVVAILCMVIIFQLASCGKDSEPTAPEPGYYIGNVNTHIFHRPSCSYLPDEENRITFQTREEAMAAGYDPCQHCNP